MPNVERWGLWDNFRLRRILGPYLDRAARRILEDPSLDPHEKLESLADAGLAVEEKAAEEHPNEWVVFYHLAHKYMEVGRYADALRACKRCVDLRPNDIRSAYGLATAYNALARAAWVGKEIPESLKALATSMGDILKPEIAQAELGKLSLSLETVAAEAIRWFERVLTLGPDGESRALVEWILKGLYEEYPQLKR